MKENDCISRKQTIERLKLNFPISQGADNSRDRHRYMQAMADIQAIREMPSVAPQELKIVPIAEIKCDKDKLKELMNKAVLTVTPQEPKTGHWIDINGIYAECSNCNEEIYITGDFKFCPNCGAKMVEPQESEDT